MSKVILTAYRCTWTEGGGFTWEPMSPALARETTEARYPPDLIRAAQTFGDVVTAAHPGVEFFVCHSLARGERAFPGYRKLASRLYQRKRPCDDLTPEQRAATETRSRTDLNPTPLRDRLTAAGIRMDAALGGPTRDFYDAATGAHLGRGGIVFATFLLYQREDAARAAAA